MKMGTVIASRQLNVLEDPSTEVVVEIGKPRPVEGVWECPYRVRGLGDDGVLACRGVDSLQAMLHSIERARQKVETLRGERILSWSGSTDGEVGLPLIYPVTSLGRAFSDHLARMITQEIDTVARVTNAWIERILERRREAEAESPSR